MLERPAFRRIGLGFPFWHKEGNPIARGKASLNEGRGREQERGRYENEGEGGQGEPPSRARWGGNRAYGLGATTDSAVASNPDIEFCVQTWWQEETKAVGQG